MRSLMTLACAAILCTASTLAQTDDGRDRGRDGRIALEVYLDLTEEQSEELATIRSALGEDLRALQRQIGEKRRQIKDELNSDVPDANLIGQLTIEIKGLNEDQRAAREESRPLSLAVLDDRQVELLRPLEVAIRLERPARQAVRVNLIGRPFGEDGEE